MAIVYAAGSTVHEEGFARLRSTGHEDVRPHRGGGFGQGRRFDKADAPGHPEQLPGRDGDLLRVPAPGEQRAYFVARLLLGHALADDADPAGDLQSRAG
jgi:hypothetical protein